MFETHKFPFNYQLNTMPAESAIAGVSYQKTEMCLNLNEFPPENSL